MLEDEFSSHLQLSCRISCTVDLPEVSAVIEVAVGLPWNSMVEEVERFSPEFESSFPPDRELTEDRSVHIDKA